MSVVPNFAGDIAPHVKKVLPAFEKNFDDGLELGAAFCVFAGDECIIDIRGGFADRKSEKPWTEDTIACIYSSGKAALSFLAARAVSDGKLDYDAAVAAYWPAFAENGKESITVAKVLSHQAGLSGIPDEMPPAIWLNWEESASRIAAMAPLWTPGTANGYHPQTVGYIIGEVLRRIEGRTIGELLRALTDSDSLQLFCGLGAEEMARTAEMPKPPKAPDLGELNDYTKLAFLKPWSAPGRVAREDWAAAEIPSSNMHGTARGLAQIVHPLANDGKSVSGEEVLTQDAISAALKERIRGDDLVLPFDLSWSAGLMRNINFHFGPNESAFGHAGFGGSCVAIDPENNLTAAYVMNKMSPYLVGDPRAVRLLNAVYEDL